MEATPATAAALRAAMAGRGRTGVIAVAGVPSEVTAAAVIRSAASQAEAAPRLEEDRVEGAADVRYLNSLPIAG